MNDLIMLMLHKKKHTMAAIKAFNVERFTGKPGKPGAMKIFLECLVRCYVLIKHKMKSQKQLIWKVYI